MSFDRLIDRLLSVLPLALVAYVLHRNEAERARLLATLETDRESFRNERRELINRVLFPTAMPTATRPIDRDVMRGPTLASPVDRVTEVARMTPQQRAEEQRAMLEEARLQLTHNRPGFAEPPSIDDLPLPADGDEAPA